MVDQISVRCTQAVRRSRDDLQSGFLHQLSLKLSGVINRHNLVCVTLDDQLRSGRDDNSYFRWGCECPRKIVIPTGA
jgi:hypothetical protein